MFSFRRKKITEFIFRDGDFNAWKLLRFNVRCENKIFSETIITIQNHSKTLKDKNVSQYCHYKQTNLNSRHGLETF